MLGHMTEKKKEPERNLEPWDYKIYHDSTGVMHFLPPKSGGRVRTERTTPSSSAPGA